jgi:hypothetical protein
MQTQDFSDTAKLAGVATWLGTHLAGINWGTVSNILATIIGLITLGNMAWTKVIRPIVQRHKGDSGGA